MHCVCTDWCNTKSPFLQWIELELGYPLGIDLQSKQHWSLLFMRFLPDTLRSGTSQSGFLGVKLGHPVTGVKLDQLQQWRRYPASG